VALELAATKPPDIVISEARFPDMDRFLLVEKIMGPIPDPVVFVMVTGYNHLRDRATLAGFHHFFLKPANPDELAQLVGKIHNYCPDQEQSPVHA
jgi:YesN/AraC family two-component response regulator